MGLGSKLEVLAIIPARGGSKGLPDKHTRELGGRPLIAWAIQAACAAATVDRVIVSTDSEAIAQAAREAGAEVPFLRPAHLAGDGADLQDVVFHLIDRLAETENYRPDIHVTILPTFPFIGAANIDAVVQRTRDGSFSAFTLAPWRHRFDALYMEECSRLVPLQKAEGKPAAFLVETGRLCVAKTAVTAVHTPPVGSRLTDDHNKFRAYVDTMMEKGLLHTERIGQLVEDETCLVDVDTAADLQLARKVLEKGFCPVEPISSRTGTVEQ